MIFVFLAGIIAIILGVVVFVRQRSFGKVPTGRRLERIRKSRNFRNGSFQNLNPTPTLTEGVSYFEITREFFFTKKVRTIPTVALPSRKTELLNLDKNKNVLVWFGHSSYFFQVDGKRYLVDPVFSGSASPLPGTPAFPGTDIVSVNDLPEIDFLVITHDHWDHLDFKTIASLRSKVGHVVTGLGVGEHLEFWGYASDMITELDWRETTELAGTIFHCVPARHFSGRGLLRNRCLWSAFVVKTTTMTLLIGGDSGYDSHFTAIGDQFGPFDLVILECGQYDKSWKYIHLLPEEFLTAAKDLRARKILPVHSCKFKLGNHPWDEPLRKITEYNSREQLGVITPMIGECVHLDDETQTFSRWWEGIN